MMRTNKTPFTDACELIMVTAVTDADGYDTITEVKTPVYCSTSRGVVRSEYYTAMMAGVQASITVEIWEEDFNGAEHLEFEGKRYKIGRIFPSGHGTIEMTCAEVKR